MASEAVRFNQKMNKIKISSNQKKGKMATLSIKKLYKVLQIIFKQKQIIKKFHRVTLIFKKKDNQNAILFIKKLNKVKLIFNQKKFIFNNKE